MKMDLRTAEWIKDNVDNKEAFPIQFSECEKCGALFITSLPHDCNKVVEVPVHEVSDGDKISEI